MTNLLNLDFTADKHGKHRTVITVTPVNYQDADLSHWTTQDYGTMLDAAQEKQVLYLAIGNEINSDCKTLLYGLLLDCGWNVWNAFTFVNEIHKCVFNARLLDAVLSYHFMGDFQDQIDKYTAIRTLCLTYNQELRHKRVE